MDLCTQLLKNDSHFNEEYGAFQRYVNEFAGKFKIGVLLKMAFDVPFVEHPFKLVFTIYVPEVLGLKKRMAVI